VENLYRSGPGPGFLSFSALVGLAASDIPLWPGERSESARRESPRRRELSTRTLCLVIFAVLLLLVNLTLQSGAVALSGNATQPRSNTLGGVLETASRSGAGGPAAFRYQ
jgi:hypothetical protein